MVGHRRAPGVEHRGGADAGAEVLGISGDGKQCLRRGAEQQVVDNRLVLVGDWSDLGRQREHQVEITTGNRSAWRAASQSRAAAPWHLGQ